VDPATELSGQRCWNNDSKGLNLPLVVRLKPYYTRSAEAVAEVYVDGREVESREVCSDYGSDVAL
jgi:hypothetical protein